jgi:hypothetical protein
MLDPLLQVAGRAHPLLLHLPIGMLVALVSLEALALIRLLELSTRVRAALATLVFLAAAASIATGLLLEQEPGYAAGQTIWLHKWLGISVGIGTLLTLLSLCTKRSRKAYPVPLSPNARHAAAAADWPGNVRELANAIEAAVIRAAGTGATQVEPAHLFPGVTPDPATTLTFHASTRRFQAELLAKALADHDWNVTQTAHDLDLTRAHVHNLIRAFGLTRTPSSS